MNIEPEGLLAGAGALLGFIGTVKTLFIGPELKELNRRLSAVEGETGTGESRLRDVEKDVAVIEAQMTSGFRRVEDLLGRLEENLRALRDVLDRDREERDP